MRYAKYAITITLCFNLIFGGILTATAQLLVEDTMDFPIDILSEFSGGTTAVATGATVPPTVSSAINDALLAFKEFSIDVLIKGAINQVKAMLIQDTLAWMAGGFEGGGPMFVQNPGQYFQEAGDEVSGAFVAELGNTLVDDPDFFCKDFAPDIIFNFANYSRSQGMARCTINDVADNIEGFTDNFQNGGWESWFRMTSGNNNPIGLRLNLLEEHLSRVSVRRRDVEIETNTGQGFKPIRECVEWENREVQRTDFVTTAPPTEKVCKKYINKSIGKAVEGSLSPVLSSNINSLEAADEISELLGAMIDAAIQGAIKKGFEEIRS